MTFEEQKKKLGTLPWQALYDLAISKEVDEAEVNGKDKDTIITRLLNTSLVNDEEINRLVDDYIYGNRITFTLWTFNKNLSANDYDSLLQLVDWYEPVLDSDYFRNLHILSVEDGTDRFEILYVYSKEYSFTNEEGHDSMVCLPKLFYSILPGYRPQPHKGGEYGDISGEVSVGATHYEMKGIIKKNTKNSGRTTKTGEQLVEEYLLSTTKEGEEIIRQFVEQGMVDSRCQLIAVIAPQYFDHDFKGTLRYLARLSNKKVVFIELDEVCKIIETNDKITL